MRNLQVYYESLSWQGRACSKPHGNAANPSLNGTLRHADINHVLSHRAQEKIDKYRAGYAALDVRKAFLPAVVSTSGRIHGDLLRLLYLLADNKTVHDVGLSWRQGIRRELRGR